MYGRNDVLLMSPRRQLGDNAAELFVNGLAGYYIRTDFAVDADGADVSSQDDSMPRITDMMVN